MIQYFYNPKGQSLIIYDEDKREIAVVERIMTVRVFVGGEVGIGDFGDDTHGIARRARKAGGAENEGASVVGRKKQPKKRKCRACGELGHRSDNCPNSNGGPTTTEGSGDTTNDS
jgi:hypothetical protein